MTVADLEELCAKVKDKEMEVFFGYQDQVLNGFRFMPACIVESGVAGLPGPDDKDGTGPIERHIFAIMPCGQQCAEQNGDNDSEDKDEEQLPPAIFN